MQYHAGLTLAKWEQFSLAEQLANIGSEVERAIKWKNKGNPEYSRKAFERALELLDLTLADPKNKGRLKEISRTREALADHFYFDSTYNSSDEQWHRYFHAFNYAARVTAGR